MVIADINDEKFILMCVYGYNERGKNKMFISDLCKLLIDCMRTYSTDKIIVGGDFNLAPDLWLDRQPPKAQCHKYDDLIVDLINRANLVDYWRVKNPSSIQFSWFNPSGNGQSSRIDYWLISSPLVNYVSKCDISALPLTDHCVITLSFVFSTPEPGLNHAWKFNNTLLNNDLFCKDVRQLIVETDALEMSSVNKWEWLKFKTRELAIRASKNSSKFKRQKQQNIITNINNLCLKPKLSREELVELNKLQNELDHLYLEKAKGAFIRSRARWIEEGEKKHFILFQP